MVTNEFSVKKKKYMYINNWSQFERKSEQKVRKKPNFLGKMMEKKYFVE